MLHTGCTLAVTWMMSVCSIRLSDLAEFIMNRSGCSPFVVGPKTATELEYSVPTADKKSFFCPMLISNTAAHEMTIRLLKET